MPESIGQQSHLITIKEEGSSLLRNSFPWKEINWIKSGSIRQ